MLGLLTHKQANRKEGEMDDFESCCSCHINPPCSYCTTERCEECKDEITDDNRSTTDEMRCVDCVEELLKDSPNHTCKEKGEG